MSRPLGRPVASTQCKVCLGMMQGSEPTIDEDHVCPGCNGMMGKEDSDD